MVARRVQRLARGQLLSVLALSSRFDGLNLLHKEVATTNSLSVLALSSRFDGRAAGSRREYWRPLSVLALSSRFDGPLSE